MGTNYYHVTDAKVCPTCEHDHGSERTHIGKSSAGWKFHFHGTENIRSFLDWGQVIASGGYIEDEYGRQISAEDFEKKVLMKQKIGEVHGIGEQIGYWLDPDGFWFSSHEFS